MGKYKGHPILFSGELVRAIIEGRKTMTRRVIKPQPDHFNYFKVPPNGGRLTQWPITIDGISWECPYGDVGETLWVRESWSQDMEGEIFWKADHLSMPSTISKWKPSIHMPRAASRITLEITDVRVERLQEISHEDAIQEGLPIRWWMPDGDDPIECFKILWHSINGKKHPWKENPWVWIISFKRI